jgi:anaerobic selenocysteine-containing dehydrogenase
MGIDDGDWVWIETLRGREDEVSVFRGIDPRVVRRAWMVVPGVAGQSPGFGVE